MTLRDWLTVALVGAVAALRLAELALSRCWLARTRDRDRAEPIAERLFLPMVALHAAWLAGCLVEPFLFPRPFLPWAVWPMAGVWAAALGLRFWMLSQMGTLWNVRLVRRETQPVVTSGPYRHVRHPNYLAVILEILSVPLITGAYWTALLASLANGAVLAVRIRSEEAYLFAIPDYRAAFSHKKRFIPGLF